MSEVIDIINSTLIKLGAQVITQSEYDNGTNKRARITKEQFPKIRDHILRQHPWNCVVRRAKLVERTFTITGATQADPVVLTVADHTYITGDFAQIASVGGMTDLNGNKYKLKTPVAGECNLYDEDDNSIDGAAFGAYTTGGAITQVPAWGEDHAFVLPDGCLRVIRLTDASAAHDYDFRIEGNELVTFQDEAYVEYIYSDEDPDNWDAVLREMVSIHLAIDVAFNLTGSLQLADYISNTYLKQALPEARSIDAQESRPTVMDDSGWVDHR